MRLGVLTGGLEGSTGRRGCVKWQWESVKEQWGGVKALNRLRTARRR